MIHLNLTRSVVPLITVFAAAPLALTLAGCASSPSAPAAPTSQHAAMSPADESGIVHQASDADVAKTHSTAPIAADKAELYVNGLGCPLCASNIDKVLTQVPGVISADVDLAQGTVLVAFAGPQHPSPHRLSEAVADAGFTLVKVQGK